MSEQTLITAATRMKALKDEIDELTAEKTALQKEYDRLRFIDVPEEMENIGVNKMSIRGVGTVYTKTDVRASIPAAFKDQSHEWLRDNGYGDLIVETINSSTFKAWAKERLIEGDELPDELFKIDPYTFAVINKS